MLFLCFLKLQDLQTIVLRLKDTAELVKHQDLFCLTTHTLAYFAIANTFETNIQQVQCSSFYAGTGCNFELTFDYCQINASIAC